MRFTPSASLSYVMLFVEASLDCSVLPYNNSAILLSYSSPLFLLGNIFNIHVSEKLWEVLDINSSVRGYKQSMAPKFFSNIFVSATIYTSSEKHLQCLWEGGGWVEDLQHTDIGRGNHAKSGSNISRIFQTSISLLCFVTRRKPVNSPWCRFRLVFSLLACLRYAG